MVSWQKRERAIFQADQFEINQVIVGLNFDRNINGLSRDFIYLPEQGRNVMVDVRAIRAALDVVYDADRIVAEIVAGLMYETEEAADAAAVQGE